MAAFAATCSLYSSSVHSTDGERARGREMTQMGAVSEFFGCNSATFSCLLGGVSADSSYTHTIACNFICTIQSHLVSSRVSFLLSRCPIAFSLRLYYPRRRCSWAAPPRRAAGGPPRLCRRLTALGRALLCVCRLPPRLRMRTCVLLP